MNNMLRVVIFLMLLWLVSTLVECSTFGQSFG